MTAHQKNPRGSSPPETPLEPAAGTRNRLLPRTERPNNLWILYKAAYRLRRLETFRRLLDIVRNGR